jgi:hypothetical protein
LTLTAGEHKTIDLQGTIKRAGYYNITANASGSQWHEPVAGMFGFNAQSNDSSASITNRQAASGIETLDTHLANLPKLDTPEAYNQLATAQVIDDAKNLDGVRLDARLENLKFDKRDGTKTEPFNTVLTYLPDSGSGQPRPEDLVPPTAAQKAKVKPRGIGCGASTTATVTATISYNGKTQILPNTKISVWDENPWLNPSYIAAGFTDANGKFSFQKPDCDWGAWWDYSGVDIYFVVESVDNRDIGTWNILAPIYNSTYGARTGTNWDAPGNTFSANLTAGNSDSENAIWLYRMVQMAQDFNVGAGGAGATYFPIRVAWPTRIDPTGWFGSGTSFAPVAKLEILGPHWLYPYIAWHEFGHNMMYRTANPNGYTTAYNGGAFSIALPAFAFGTHGIASQENIELAYNEGFANYFYVMVQDYYAYYFNSWGFVGWEDYYLRGCNTALCGAYPVGDQSEARVSTFL